MLIEKRKIEIASMMVTVIAEAETLIDRLKAAYTALEDVNDLESSIRYEKDVASHIMDGLKHIQVK